MKPCTTENTPHSQDIHSTALYDGGKKVLSQQ
uniref:Uncharacterized protein n=1 Tax=Anguilla anguilla TaxID=7936 RepID=A0A0E9WKQ8_ANGAN